MGKLWLLEDSKEGNQLEADYGYLQESMDSWAALNILLSSIICTVITVTISTMRVLSLLSILALACLCEAQGSAGQIRMEKGSTL